MEPPAGTVTFLFTDLAGSTQLWERDSEQMRAALTRHDAIVRAMAEAGSGLVVKSTGDGFMIAFGVGARAVATAVDIQRAIAAEEWQVPIALRIGLHTGAAQPIGGDYHAPAVNRAARIAQAAHPEQILVSSSTAALADGLGLRDLGERYLKGLPLIRLFQVVADGLRHDFPELESPASGLMGLPSPITSFVGREEELERLARHVCDERIVTVTGVGGCGKTRLAIEVARRVAPDFADGVRFVDLAPITEDARVHEVVGAALGLGDDITTEPLDRLAGYLASRRVLVVLDNCEHLLDGSAALAEAVGSRATTSRLLATSREPLGVDGEHIHAVRSLDADTDAVQLFVDRASHVRDGFTVDEAGRVTVAEICRRLDGIPLAIELAAAQVTHLSLPQLLERLNDRFGLLVGGRRRVQRQQTLAATLDWSHTTLTDDEQATFRRLAVFPADFTLDAAEAVVGGRGVVRDLAFLVAKSLVAVGDEEERFRYRMLETVRMYAEDRLVDAREAAEYRTRHRDWVLEWLESVPLDERWFGDDDPLRPESANVRAALDWSATRGDSVALARIAAGFDWTRSDARGEGIRWCERAVADALPVDLDGQVSAMLAVLCTTGMSGDQGMRWSERAVGAGDAIADEFLATVLAWLSANRAVEAVAGGDAALAESVRAMVARCVATSERCTGPWQVYCSFVAGMALGTLAVGDVELRSAAEQHFRDAAARVPTDVRFAALRATLYEYLALFRLLAGDEREALEFAVHAPSGDGRWPMFGPNQSAARILALAASGDAEAAGAELQRMDDAFRRGDVERGREIICMYAGALAAIAGEWERAAQLLAAGRSGVFAGAEAGLTYFRYRDLTRAALGSEAARALREAGMAMPVDEAYALARPRMMGSVGSAAADD